MILAVDMGNSNIVLGVIDDRKTWFMERITTDTRRTDLESVSYTHLTLPTN